MPNSETLLLGLLGHPLGHTLSPYLHEYLLTVNQVKGCYHVHEVGPENLGGAVSGLKALGYDGVNVTIPHKEAVLRHLDELTEEARLIGAVNTIFVRNGKLWGANTDCTGLNLAVRRREAPVQGAGAVVFGAGGAARAVVYSLVSSGVQKIHLFNRTISRALELADAVHKSAGFKDIVAATLWESEISRALDSASLVVNASSLGMWPNVAATPFLFQKCRDNLLAIDLVYNPQRTTFLRSAEEVGARTIDGLDAFIFQGLESMKIWTQKEVSPAFNFDRIKARLIKRLEKNESS